MQNKPSEYYKDMRLSTRIKFNILMLKMKIFLKLRMYKKFDLTALTILKVLKND
jgi:hypothetical protein